MTVRAGSVYLVGAGPGDPGLITVRGLDLLKRAEVVVYDRLIAPELLDDAPPTAQIIDAGKKPNHHKLTQDEINQTIVEHAQAGKLVVRLKGGDPYVFGRGWEELVACAQAGIPCEVVPGITSAIAAPAAADLPITARSVARHFAVVTGQTGAGEPLDGLDFAALAQLDTVVFLMGRKVLPDLAQKLIDAGRPRATPAAVIERGTMAGQREIRSTLEHVARDADDAGLESPVIIVVGEVAGLQLPLENKTDAHTTAPSARRPLAGKRVVVTRPRKASQRLALRLRQLGADVIDCPLIDVHPIDVDKQSLQQAIDRKPNWVVFASRHGVIGFWRALRKAGLDARVLGDSKIAAVGPTTAGELRAIGLEPDLVPRVYRAKALIEELKDTDPNATSALLPIGTLARDEMRLGLEANGYDVNELLVYDTSTVKPSERTIRELARGVDAVIFASPSGAKGWHEAQLSDVIGHTGAQFVAIGPTTARGAEQYGITCSLIAQDHSDDGMIDALVQHYTKGEATHA